MRSALFWSIGFALLSTSVPAQEFRAAISGRVIDPTGAAVVGAEIEALSAATGIRSSARSGEDGNFVLAQLPPGAYDFTAAAAGFRKYARRGITLAVGDRATLEIKLELGDLASTVEVTAELTGIETSQSITGQVMDTKNVTELPLNGRQVFMLMQLSAGVVFTQQFFGPGGFSGTRAYDVNGELSMHGGRTNTNAFLLDGAPLGVNGQWDYAPLVDGIAEFKVATPANDASHGLTGGGVVNMTMKSGGNQVHGVVSHFIRNHIFDARRTQENRIAASRPDLAAQQHQWNDVSALVSGPIIKNKFFYMGNYEVFWDRVPRPTTQTVATMLQRAGNFSQTFNASNQLMVIYDPLTTRQSGTSYVRDPFPSNTIPGGRIIPVSQNILKQVPEPNMVTNPITNFNNFGSSPNVSRFLYNAWYMKFDYVWNEAHRTFFSETQNYGSNLANNNGFPFGNPLRTGSDPRRRNHYAATLDHIYTISNTTVLNVRAGWDRFLSYLRNASIDDLDTSSLGFKGRTGSFPSPRFPAIRFTDYVELVNGSKDYSPNDVFSIVADVSRAMNRHLFRFGARLGQARLSRNITGEWFGRFNFDKGWTQRDPQRADATSGNDIASMLLGYPASGGTDSNPQASIENKFLGLYVQDDIKVNRKLTVNLGFRWDVQTAPTERYNRLIYAFDPATTYQLGGGQAKGGFLFADNDKRQPWNTSWKDLQPRTGLAWQPVAKLVMRAGYGLSFLPLNGTGGSGGVDQTGYSRRTPFVATTGGGLSSYIPGLPGTGTFENPFPTGILPPYGAGLGVKTQLGQAAAYQNREYDVPRVHQFNFGLEYELPWKMSLEAGYVGSRTRRFPVSRALSAIPLEERLKGVADPNYLNAAVANPFAGAPELVGTSLAAATITRSQSLSPFPQFTSVTRNGNSLGNTSYNAMQVRFNKRLSSGMSLTTSYTLAKTLEATAYREPQYEVLERVIAAFDRTHHLSVAALFELPFGRGRHFGNAWSRVLDAFAGGWQYNIILEHMNGTPTAMPDAVPARDPRLTGGPRYESWFNTCTLLTNGTRSRCSSADEPVTWVQLRPNQLRTYSSYFPNLRNHWKPQINMSLFKTLRINERITFELRGEAFNAFNTPIYTGPTTTLTSANFGVVVLDQQNFPRNMQFACRVRF